MFRTAFCVSLLSVAPLLAQPTTPGPGGPTKPPAASVVARVGSLRSTLERKGRLVPTEFAPVVLELEAYSGELKIVDCLPHGTMVNAGDILARLDPSKIEEQLMRAEFDLAQAERKLESTEEEARLAEAAGEDEASRAERDLDWAQRRLRGYLEQETEFDREQDRLSQQSTQHGLEDQQDELTQLEKMYKEDELVDATEEIVLKRARRSLASAQAWAKLRLRRSQYDFEGPKVIERERLELETMLKTKALERTRRSRELTRVGRQLGLERARFDLEQQRQGLRKLQRDRERLTVRAPRAGILLHGAEDSVPSGKTLEKGGRVMANTVPMTVADPGRFEVLTEVPEGKLYEARTGKAVEIELLATPDIRLGGALRVDYLPSGREGDVNLYRAHIALAQTDPRWRPGMGGKVTVVLAEAKNAVIVPMTSVVTEDGRKVVRCAKTADGPFEPRQVTLGPDDGKNVAIERGVAAGEFVLLAPSAGKSQ